VHEEIEHVRKGKHGARSAKQAIAIGCRKPAAPGIKLPPPPRTAKASTRRSAVGHAPPKRHPPLGEALARAMSRKLQREPKNTVSTKALSRRPARAARPPERASARADRRAGRGPARARGAPL
jgi:hypothetical protein